MYSIFVSSTFKDMQFERDYIKNILTPKFNHLLSPFGESVNFSDLRWGVNTIGLDEEEANKKVLKICLDEIDSDRRYFIVFIGERYGWIPPQELMLETIQSKGINNLATDISVTNLEIEYGAFSLKKAKPIFFFRHLDTSNMSEEEKKIYESESPLHKQKLELLKNKIKEQYGDVVFDYYPKWDKDKKEITGLEEVMNILYDKLSTSLNDELTAHSSLTKYQKAIMTSESYFLACSKDTYHRSDKTYKIPEVKDYNDYYDSDYNDLPVYCSTTSFSEGMGKRTYITSLYEESKKDKRYISVPFACGINQYTDSVEEFINVIHGVVNEALGHGHNDIEMNEKIISKTAEVIEELNKTNLRIRLFIINATHDVVGLIKYFEAVTTVTNITFIVQDESNFSEADKVIPVPFYNHNIYFPIYDLESDEDKVGVIKAIVHKKHKELSDKVIKEILKKEQSGVPLYLSLIIERLLYLNNEDFKNIRALGDDMNAIEKYMCQIVKSSSGDVKGIAKELLIDLINVINKDMLLPFIRLMTYDFRFKVYPYGEQKESEIESFFKYIGKSWNKIDYLLFIHSIPSLFLESSLNDDIVKFKTNEIKEVAKEICDELEVEELYVPAIDFINQSDLYSEEEKVLLALTVYSEYEDVHHFALAYLRFCELTNNHKYSSSFMDVLDLIDKKHKEQNRFFFDVLEEIIEILKNKKGDEYISNYVGYFFLPFAYQSNNQTVNEFAEDFGGEILTHAYVAYKENPKNKYLKGIVSLYVIFAKDHLYSVDYYDEVDIIEEDIENNKLMDEFLECYEEIVKKNQGPLNFFINAYDEFGYNFGEVIANEDDDTIEQYIKEIWDNVFQYFEDRIINEPLLKDALDINVKEEDVSQYAHGQLVIVSAMRFFIEFCFIKEDVKHYFDIFIRLLKVYLIKYSFISHIGGNIDQIKSLKQIAHFLCGMNLYNLDDYPYIKEGLDEVTILFTKECRTYLAVYDDDVVLMDPYIRLVSDVIKDKRKDFLFVTPLVVNCFYHGFRSDLLLNYFGLFDEVKEEVFKDNLDDSIVDTLSDLLVALYTYDNESFDDNLITVIRDYLMIISPFKIGDGFEVKSSKKKDPLLKTIYDRLISVYYPDKTYKEFLSDL